MRGQMVMEAPYHVPELPEAEADLHGAEVFLATRYSE